MLHLAGRITFGVNVRDLFQLQRPFECDREVDATTEVEKISRAEEFFRKLFDAVRVVEQVLELHRQLRELLGVKTRFVFGENTADLAQVQTQKIKRDHLARERLRRSHANSRTSVRENRAVSFTT